MASCSQYLSKNMRNRITIQQVTQTTDGQGGFTEAWSTYTQAWCSIEPVRSFERFQAQQMETPISHKIIMRYQSGITTKMRILFGARVLDIKGVENVNEESAYLKITAIEKA